MKPRTSMQRSAARIDNRIAHARDVLLERLVPRVAVDAFEFDCFDKLLDVLVQRIRTLRLVVKAFLRQLISDVVLDALAASSTTSSRCSRSALSSCAFR